MNAIINYSKEQYSLIIEIQKLKKYQNGKIRLLVLMSTNNYARTKEDLAGILCGYPGLSDREELLKLIDLCLSEGYLTNNRIFGTLYCLQDKECLEKFLSELPEDLRNRILNCRKQYDSSIRVRVDGLLSGGGKQGYINAEFKELLQDAQSEILLPMFNTSASSEVLKILKNKAKAGVQIRILLADYDKVVSKYRPGKQSTIEEWAKPLNNLKNIEIRIFTRLEDGDIYSSVVVDRKICKICVFDVQKEVSSKGTLITCVQEPGENINIIKLIIERFWDIWAKSYPVNVNKKWYFFIRYRIWQLLVACGCCFFYLKSSNDLFKELSIFIGTAVGTKFFSFIWVDLNTFLKDIIRKISHL